MRRINILLVLVVLGLFANVLALVLRPVPVVAQQTTTPYVIGFSASHLSSDDLLKQIGTQQKATLTGNAYVLMSDGSVWSRGLYDKPEQVQSNNWFRVATSTW